MKCEVQDSRSISISLKESCKRKFVSKLSSLCYSTLFVNHSQPLANSRQRGNTSLSRQRRTGSITTASTRFLITTFYKTLRWWSKARFIGLYGTANGITQLRGSYRPKCGRNISNYSLSAIAGCKQAVQTSLRIALRPVSFTRSHGSNAGRQSALLSKCQPMSRNQSRDGCQPKTLIVDTHKSGAAKRFSRLSYSIRSFRSKLLTGLTTARNTCKRQYARTKVTLTHRFNASLSASFIGSCTPFSP